MPTARRRPQLDDPPQVHDRDPVGDVPDGGQVVGDEQQREPELPLQPAQQVQHLRLDADVEGGDRLVADQEVGLAGQCAGDADPLPLTAGELVRIPVGDRGVQPDQLQQLGHPRRTLAPAGPELVHLQRLGHRLRDRAPRVERGERVLEHHAGPPAQGAQPPAVERGHVDAVEDDRAGGRLHQPQQRVAQRRLRRTPTHRPDRASRRG